MDPSSHPSVSSNRPNTTHSPTLSTMYKYKGGTGFTTPFFHLGNGRRSSFAPETEDKSIMFSPIVHKSNEKNEEMGATSNQVQITVESTATTVKTTTTKFIVPSKETKLMMEPKKESDDMAVKSPVLDSSKESNHVVVKLPVLKPTGPVKEPKSGAVPELKAESEDDTEDNASINGSAVASTGMFEPVTETLARPTAKLPRTKWTHMEDNRMRACLVKLYGENFIAKMKKVNWADVAKLMKTGRNAKQCRDRWVNFTRPGLKKGNWEQWEIEKIQDLHLQFGPKWSTISKMFENRAENDIKNKFYSMQRQQERTRAHVFTHLNKWEGKLAPEAPFSSPVPVVKKRGKDLSKMIAKVKDQQEV